MKVLWQQEALRYGAGPWHPSRHGFHPLCRIGKVTRGVHICLERITLMEVEGGWPPNASQP